MTWDAIIVAELSGRRPVCSVCRGTLIGDGVCKAGCTSCTLVWLHPDGSLRPYSVWSRRQIAGEGAHYAQEAGTSVDGLSSQGGAAQGD